MTSSHNKSDKQSYAPNLLVIHTDEQSAWTIGAYGGTLVETPNIDRLAHEGAICTNFFTNSAICTPSRGCLLTGRYPHVHGAFANNEILKRDEITWAQVLTAQGYETGYAGKWHLDGNRRPGWLHADRSMGFTDCQFMFNRGHWKRIEEWEAGGDMEPTVFPYHEVGDAESYTTDWLTTKAIDFLHRPRQAPFAYMLSIPDPHTPFTIREPYASMFSPDGMPLPRTLRPESLPRWARAEHEKERRAIGDDWETVTRQRKAAYCGMVECIDDNVGRLLAALEEDGQLDNTVVVFTTDHGQYMGEHGLFEKNTMYETAYRIPLLIRWPARIAAGTRVDRIMDTVDFQSTLLSLMGMPTSGREQGRNASPLLRGESCDWDDVSYVHHNTHTLAGIFTPDWELILDKDGDHALFNRKTDPDQIENRYADPACREAVEELTGRIVRHHVAVDSPARAWLAPRQTGGAR